MGECLEGPPRSAKADHSAAHRQPLFASGQRPLATITPRGPQFGCWGGLFTRTLDYLAAPQRYYNIVATLGTWLVKIPVMGYFDDFGLITSVPPTGEASPEFSERNEIFGFVLRLSKSEWAGSSSFEGS